MSRNFNIFYLVCGLILFSQVQVKASHVLKQKSSALFIEFCQAIIREQVTSTTENDYGSIHEPLQLTVCPVAGEAVFPLAMAYKITRNKKFGIAAIRLANWYLKKHARSHLATRSEPLELARSNQLLSMVLAYPILKNNLSPGLRQIWQKYFIQLGEYLSAESSIELGECSSQKLAWAAAALSALDKLLPQDRWRVSAEKFAFEVTQRMNEEGFIVEVGSPAKTSAIAPGVTFESTLPALALFAHFTARDDVTDFVRKALTNALYFIFPDGAVDNSWGICSANWSSFGNLNTAGSQSVFSLYLDYDSRFEAAALRNLSYLADTAVKGFLPLGAHFYQNYSELPTLVPTIRKAFNLALSLEFGISLVGEKKVLPADIVGWYNHFKTLDVLVIRTAGYMATLSANHYLPPATESAPGLHRPSGGALTNLWSEEIGFIQTASQTVYQRPTAYFPEVSVNPLPLTPRIECRNEDDYFTNLYEFNGKLISRENQNGVVQVLFSGNLKNWRQQSGDVKCIQNYFFYENIIKKELRLIYQGQKRQVEVVEPFVIWPGARIDQSDLNTVLIKYPHVTWRLRILDGEAEIKLGEQSECYQWPVRGYQAFPVTIRLPKKKQGEQLDLVYCLEKVSRSNRHFVDFAIE